MQIEEALNKILNYIETNNQIQKDLSINFNNVHSFEIQKHKIICRELSWKEGLAIDASAFKTQNKNFYFSSEKEKEK